jgi:NTP pyrophosphatase (non-canonical NTP hydrolase)
MTIQQAQKIVDEWIKSYGVRYYNEMTNFVILTEEVGELARLFARHFGEQSFKPGHEPENIIHEIADEMADIFFVLICLANQMNIDLQTALEKNINKKTQRDKERHQNNPKLQ